MKTKALKRFREKLSRDEPLIGMWITLEAPAIVEMAVSLGLDWVVIDAEHGHLGWPQITEHIRAAVRSQTVVLVRISELSTAASKRALDVGADGIVIPWIETADQLTSAIQDCLYPPEGRRGIGGERATAWGQCIAEHANEANEHVLVVPMIESVAGGNAIQEMCDEKGIEVFFFGPADYSSSAGYRGQWEGPGVARQILDAVSTIRRSGKHCGVVATDDQNLQLRSEQGFQMLGVGADTGLLLRSLHQSLEIVGRDCQLAASLDAEDAREIVAPLARPPESMRPDRKEIVTRLCQGHQVEIEPGISSVQMVGELTSARGLTTAIVTIEAGARLTTHTHPCSESITALEGTVEIVVEGRVYLLERFDNIVIPRWLPHTARNPSTENVARVHVALAMTAPTRETCSDCFQERSMPQDSIGMSGFERVTRFATALRTSGVGPGAQFVDYFNADLMPGIEMSGGFADFDPEGRLPAHVHDFDESICIVAGTAICNVEGRIYDLDDCATAMVPRGRVHYFMNESDATMAMIWVYAGPLPNRIIVDESCATENGNPWGA